MAKHIPIIAGPVSDLDIIEMFSNPENLEDMAWAFSDWLEASDWLNKQGAPQYTEEGNWNPMMERIKWLINTT
jgi:hypothetical protein